MKAFFLSAGLSTSESQRCAKLAVVNKIPSPKKLSLLLFRDGPSALGLFSLAEEDGVLVRHALEQIYPVLVPPVSNYRRLSTLRRASGVGLAISEEEAHHENLPMHAEEMLSRLKEVADSMTLTQLCSTLRQLLSLPDASLSGTTACVVLHTPDGGVAVANVGDSRIYRSRGESLEQLSRDHTSAWGQWKRGEISEIEYRAHPRRAALYEVVGGGQPMVNPHFAAIPYEAGDRFLICSDGLIDGLWERHLSNGLAQCSNDPSVTAASLLARAITNAGADDTSLVIVTVSRAK
jgi:serine/threonine protein phosphatase PrpC